MTTHKPHFLFRLFGLANWTLTFTERGVSINGEVWPWEGKLDFEVLDGRFWKTGQIRGPRRLTLRGMTGAVAEQVQTLSHVAKPILDAHSSIDRTLSRAAFICDLDRRALVYELQRTIHWKDRVGPVHHLRHVPHLYQKYSRICRYIDGDRQELDLRNEQFVDAELLIWRDWFAKIEKTPLTDEQAQASVVMEDCNLLIAAAGSGKTSTIVAKAAYAIAKGYCQPSELLVLTFNARIQEELTERLQKRISTAGHSSSVAVETFHAFGNKQVRQLNKSVRLASWADSPTKEMAHLRSIINGLVKNNAQFAVALAEFSVVWLESDEKEEEEILAATETGSFQDAMRKLLNRAAPKGAVPTYNTLAGETVRSLQELRICNWLTLMGIQYEYERPFDEKHVPTDWKSGYRPDFYYPAIDCWHEHFGINKFGKAPPWMTRPSGERQRTYEDEVEAKRQLLARCRVDWFETTSADFDNGSWETKLRKELTQRGLNPSFIGWEKFVEGVQSSEAITKAVITLVLTCLRHAKSNRFAPKDLAARLSGTVSQRARAFLKVFVPLYEAYEGNLRQRGEIDFEDMVILSADAFRAGRLNHPYQLILVDEFQDVSNSRAELLAAMMSQSPDVKLFGVGDDWQSIYRFAGADISAMTQFNRRFGFTATNYLTRTFRSNQFIADAASSFVMRNPAQLRKQVRASTRGDTASIEVVFHTGASDEFLSYELSLLAQQHRGKARKLAVLLLGRYNFLKPQELDAWQHEHGGELDVSFLTIHKSKGLEADVVFLLGASNRKGQDFPSTISDDPLLSLFMPSGDQMAWSEERRLFYVALTRARQKVYIITPEGRASPFVTELLASTPVSTTLYNGSKTPLEDAKPHLRRQQCPRCEKGTVMRRTSEFGPFEFCTLKCGYKKNVPTQQSSKVSSW